MVAAQARLSWHVVEALNLDISEKHAHLKETYFK